MLTIILATLTCSDPIIQNTTKYPWNDYDQRTLNIAKIRCPMLYPNSPCVKLFRKYAEKNYSVVCGKPNG